jgi:hypothetical protein
MKKLVIAPVLAILIASVTSVRAQDYPEEYLGLPGDNLNLYAVMQLFQESETLEAFERNLNDENSHINNLDLNGDNYVDYITVSDYEDGNVHNIVLRAALDGDEYQDVAVFTVEKFRDGSVQIQLIGDEALYGRNYIVEPNYAETPNPGYRGRTVYRNNVTVVTTTYYEVAAWPVIRFIFNPFYVCWRSSWYWGYYPVYWRPWRPWYWHYYYGYHYNWYPHYYAYYRHWNRPRYTRYNDFYYRSIRAHSPNVSHRISQGNYRKTYSRPDLRRDGEAFYASTRDTRSSAAQPAATPGSQRRSSPSVSSRSSAGSQAGTTNSSTRRSSPATVQNRSTLSRSASQSSTSATRRSTSTTVKNSPANTIQRSATTSASRGAATRRSEATGQQSQSAAGRSSQSTISRSQSSAQRSPATVSRSQSSPQRSQATVSRSQSSAQRSQATISRSQSSSQRSQATVSRSQSSRQSVSRKSSPSVSRQSSASTARTQSRNSSPARSSSSRSSSSSKGSSSSSKSSKSSDSQSRSSRR